MSPHRSRIPLVVALCLLLGLVGYVTHLVAGAEDLDLPDLGPSSGPVVERGEPAKPAPRAAPTVGDSKPQFDLLLRIDPIADLSPPPPRRPDLRLWRGTTLVPAPGSWIAGTAALPMARVIRGKQLVGFRVPGGRQIYRVVFLGRQEQDTREAVNVRWLGSVDYQASVVGPDERPLAGARIWLAGEQAETDEEGRFRIPDLPGGSGLPLVIRAKGYASYFRVLDLARPGDGRDISRTVFALAKGVSLKVRFQAPVQDVTQGAVFVQPASSDQDTRLLHYPFFLQAIEGGVPLKPDGMATLEGLPADVRVRVSVRHPDTLVQQQPVVHLRQTKLGWDQATVAADKARCLAGKVHTMSNAPVAGAWLVSRAAGATGPSRHNATGLLPPGCYLAAGDDPVGHVVTAVDGSYRLPLAVSETQVRVSATGRQGLALHVRGRAQRAVLRRDLVLPEAAGDDQPRLKLRFANPSGRVFLLRVMEGRRLVQEPFTLTDADDYAQPLGAMVLADIHVEVRAADGTTRSWAFPNRVIRGLSELALDY